MTSGTLIIPTGAGIELSVTVSGAGPLVILMHGWPELGLSWRHQVAALATAGYRVAVPDMRGYGLSSKPARIEAYDVDTLADDMAAVAAALGARRWIAVGHDWGAPVAWRSALRFPDAVAGVFALSVPHAAAPPAGQDAASADAVFADRFWYVRYFQPVGPAEAELERDPRAALKKIFHALSGDAPLHEWIRHRPADSSLLDGLADPPPAPLSFMTDAELDRYAGHYRAGGFLGPLNWYRNIATNAAQARRYGEQRIRQPAGFLCGDKEIVLAFGGDPIARQRALCDDLRVETILPDAGHWIQQERPAEVNAALIAFLRSIGID